MNALVFRLTTRWNLIHNYNKHTRHTHPHSSSQQRAAAAAAVAHCLAAAMPALRLFQAYANLLAKHPWQTQIVSTGALWCGTMRLPACFSRG